MSNVVKPILQLYSTDTKLTQLMMPADYAIHSDHKISLKKNTYSMLADNIRKVNEDASVNEMFVAWQSSSALPML
jgi:arginine/lysine/ornithine decarboxylase